MAHGLSIRFERLTFFKPPALPEVMTPDHAPRLARILDRLDASASPDDMNLPGFKLHRLSGREKGIWSVWVNGNWRVTFQFEGADAVIVDYRDYH